MGSRQFTSAFELFNAFCTQERKPIRILKAKNPPTSLSTMPNHYLTVQQFEQPEENSPRKTANSYKRELDLDMNNKILVPVKRKLLDPRVVFSNTNNVASASQLIAQPRKSPVSSDSSFEVDFEGKEYIVSVDSSNSGTDDESEEVSVINAESDLKITNIVTLSGQAMRRITSQRLNHIKRPLNAFMAFSKVTRRKIMLEDPTLHHAAVSKKLGSTWKAMSPEEKQPYFDEARKLADEHVRLYPDYKYRPRPKKPKSEDSPTKTKTVKIDPLPIPVQNIKTEVHVEKKSQEIPYIRNPTTPAERISPSKFHAWSAIYEDDDEEEEEAEEEDSESEEMKE